MSEWISVNDRLPTQYDDGHILVLINGKPILSEVHDATLSLKDTIFFFWPKRYWVKNEYYADPTHWMKIPNIPEET